jgi:hypothetical protein
MPFLRIHVDRDDSAVLGEVRCLPEEGLVLQTLADTPAAKALADVVADIAARPGLTLRQEEFVGDELVMTGRLVGGDDPDYIWAVQEALGKRTSHWIEYVDDDDAE